MLLYVRVMGQTFLSSEKFREENRSFDLSVDVAVEIPGGILEFSRSVVCFFYPRFCVEKSENQGNLLELEYI